LVLVLVLVIAWSIDGAAWVRGQGALTDFLIWTATLGALAGFVGAKIGWSRWLAHAIGAVWAAIAIPLIVGTVIAPEGSSVVEFFRASADSARLAYLDLAILGRSTTTQYGHFLLVLGGVLWGTGQYAAGAVFRDHRPLDASIVLGLVLIANMSLTLQDQLGYLVVFSLAVLFLLIRSHAFDEQALWLRRRIGDPGELSAFYLRGGTFFVVLAVAGSLLLTGSASSSPLAGVWAGAQRTFLEIGEALERFLPTGGASRGAGVGFGDTATITGRWITDGRQALEIEVDPGETGSFYWRAATYDVFDLQSWRRSSFEALGRAPGEPLLAGTLDEVTTEGRRAVSITVRPTGFPGTIVFSPQTPLSIDQPSTLTLVGGQFFGALETDADEYTVTALVPIAGDRVEGGLTENRLRVAGTDYPAGIVERYLDVPEGAIGPAARQLLDDILAEVPADNPYDLARTMQAILRGPRFTYTDDVTNLDTAGRSVVEAFAHFRTGYCQYYASTMAILLREAGVPTRLAEGFLPGNRELGTGIERIFNSGAHAWVEVYFPGYGWVTFDPTGGGRAANLAPIPSGRPEETPDPAATPSGPLPSPTFNELGEDFEPPFTPPLGGTIQRPTGPGPFILIAVVLAAVVGALAAAFWVRGPRGPISPEAAWRGIGRLAARFGYGPRPAETVYEYAGALGEVLPEARPALLTVADARVEVAYGRRELGTDRLSALREANRRLRVALLRLVIRRGKRRRL
jgi:transglutaminase-like putative cysteine protease